MSATGVGVTPHTTTAIAVETSIEMPGHDTSA